MLNAYLCTILDDPPQSLQYVINIKCAEYALGVVAWKTDRQRHLRTVPSGKSGKQKFVL